METSVTFELWVAFGGPGAAGAKRAVRAWLEARGRDDYAEGVIDGVDLAAPDDQAAAAAALLGDDDATPIALYSFDEAELRLLAHALAQAFPAGVTTRVARLATEAWQSAWEEPGFVGFDTARFAVRNAPGEVPADKELLVVARGEAFGDGRHATTQVALEALEEAAPALVAGARAAGRAASLLDVGTGTGILAIAGARLGFARLVGTDIDAGALDEARENAAVNGVGSGLTLLCADRLPRGERFDLVCANILVPVLHALMPELAAALAPGGRLVLAGFIAKDEPALLASAAAAGLALVTRRDVRGWSALTLASS